MKSSEIRQTYIDYFKKHDHTEVPSSSLIPHDDPTLLFTNAGMNQFKRVFMGEEKLPFKRATSSQKCMRAGGKHNDLENVGQTARHQTFFEMLGNFSFGDYFKEEAIYYCWDLMTKGYGFDPQKLWVSVFKEDDEAFNLWKKIAPELGDRVLRFDENDNFWSMGDTGPCGPSSEIHIDRGEKYDYGGPASCVNGEGDRFVELWNLVFMQFNREPDGNIHPLPKPSVDTGAGLERFACVLQNGDTNYDSDLFMPIIHAIEDLSGVKYSQDKAGLSHRVIADHIRALTMTFSDGAVPSNEKRGYVLRRILRRAARHGRLLDLKEPFLYKLSSTVIDIMGSAFPEIKENHEHVASIIKSEEEKFGQTLDLGLELFEQVVEKVTSAKGTVIPGAEAFKLYDTYGFPLDLTELMARERGLTVDLDKFEDELEKQKTQSKEDRKSKNIALISINAFKEHLTELEKSGKGYLSPTELLELNNGTEYLGYDNQFKKKVKLLEVINDEDNNVMIAHLTKSPFYGESGGQVGDKGRIYADDFLFEVLDTKKQGDFISHIGKVVKGDWKKYQFKEVTAEVDGSNQKPTQRNHTATHLLHKALREVLGDHVHQAGSLVEPSRLRFDFTHFKAVEKSELELIEQKVNQKIWEDHPVKWEETDFETAKSKGAMALFGEKYGDKVRMVQVDDYSLELCGGTHVQSTGEIGLFVIVSESAIAAGMRRIEAVTGAGAFQYLRRKSAITDTVSQMLKTPADKLTERIISLTESEKNLSRELNEIKKQQEKASVKDKLTEGESVNGVTLIIDTVAGRDAALTYTDQIKKSENPTLVGLLNDNNYFIAASPSAIDKGVTAQKAIKYINDKYSGRGGGKPHFAQGGTKEDISLDGFKTDLNEFLQSMG